MGLKRFSVRNTLIAFNYTILPRELQIYFLMRATHAFCATMLVRMPRILSHCWMATMSSDCAFSVPMAAATFAFFAKSVMKWGRGTIGSI